MNTELAHRLEAHAQRRRVLAATRVIVRFYCFTLDEWTSREYQARGVWERSSNVFECEIEVNGRWWSATAMRSGRVVCRPLRCAQGGNLSQYDARLC